MTDFGVAEILELPDREHRAGLAAPRAIELRGLTKCFGPTWALGGVDLDVAPGHIVAVIGENGAGKSTLIRILATVVLPDEGTARVAGHDVVDEALAVRRQVGLALGDDRSFFWRLTGRKNLEFFGRLQGLRGKELPQRVAELLNVVALTDVADRRVDRYSTGMRNRLGIARALLGDPAVLLLDEPTRSLDAVATASVRQLVGDIARKKGTTVVMATHDLEEASALADQVVVLAGGQVTARLRSPVDPAELRRRLRGPV